MAKKKSKKNKKVLTNQQVTWSFVALALVLATVIAIGLSGFAGTPKKSCSIVNTVGVKNYSAKNGYYFLPRADGNYSYNRDIFLAPPKGAEGDTISKKPMIQWIEDASYQWALADGGSNKFTPGDSYSKGHAVHTSGNVIDLYGVNNKLFSYKAYHLMGSKFVKNPDYSRVKTEDLAKALINTGTVTQILYSDKTVVKNVNTWAKKNKKPQVMVYQREHLDHFHVKVNLAKYECK